MHLSRPLWVLLGCTLSSVLAVAQTPAPDNLNWNDVSTSLINKFLNSDNKFIQATYSAPDDGDNGSGWGIKYDWKKDGKLTTDIDSENFSRFSQSTFSGYAKGSYTHSDTFDPEALSKVGLAYRYAAVSFPKLSAGGRLNEQASRLQQQCVLDNPDQADGVTYCNQKLNLFKDNENKHSHAYFFNVKIDLEGSEDFSERQYVYGVGAGYKYVPPQGHWTRWLNPIDWPLWATRKLSDYQGDYVHTLPVLIAGIDQIDPSNNQNRKQVSNDEDNYQRVYGEVAYSAPLGLYKGHKIKFNYSYRYYRELDAPPEIRAARLDRFRYSAYAIQIPSAVFNLGKNNKQEIVISYSSGKLPFSQGSDQVVELGWKANVDLLEIAASALGY